MVRPLVAVQDDVILHWRRGPSAFRRNARSHGFLCSLRCGRQALGALVTEPAAADERYEREQASSAVAVRWRCLDCETPNR